MTTKKKFFGVLREGVLTLIRGELEENLLLLFNTILHHDALS